MQILRERLGLFFCTCTLVTIVTLSASGLASAADLYATGDIRISWSQMVSGGQTTVGNQSFPNTGTDWDSSPAYGGGFGMGFRLDEVIIGETDLPGTDWTLSAPEWTVRAEIQALAGRDYEFRTQSVSTYFTDTSTWSTMANLWVDIPVYEPLEWAFGRVPLLEPLSFYMGGGLGMASTKAETTNGVSRGSERVYNFAYQAGAGLGYALTDYVSLSFGYRYVNLGSDDLELQTGPNPAGELSLDLAVHEFATTIRVNFYSFPLIANPF